VARILFLTQVLPYPLYGGAKIRGYYMLRSLAAEHEVTLVSFTRADDRAEDIAHLRGQCDVVHTVPMERSVVKDGRSFLGSAINGKPAVILRDRLPAMEATLARLVAEAPFDAIHADQTSMAQYGLFARDCHAEGKRPSTVLDQHNALYLVVQRQAEHERGRLRQHLWRREARLLAQYEATLLGDYDTILTVTAEDKEALLRLLPREAAGRLAGRIKVVPICVDPAEREMIEPIDQEPPRILHLGTMFWPPNIEGVLWFAEHVLPRVLDEVPEAVFTIAGKNPPPEVRALADKASPTGAHVEVTGFVADPLPLLAASRVFVVPLLAGGGMRVKILDAWLWGLPVVSTQIGAEGLLTRPGENILLADDRQEFAAAVVRVLSEQEMAFRLRENGRKWVERHYNWREVYRNLDSVYGQVRPVQA
jgi:glycosyltransferase involved in cell wall biosynthesis